MKWLRLATVLAMSCMALAPCSALAATSQDVTVTATGYICGVPGDFTLTYVSDTEVGISWTKGDDAANTMIRAAYGRLPESRTDGYLVYYGAGASTSDTAVNLDETASRIFYRAWSQNENEVWEEVGVSDFFEGYGVTLIAFVILTVALMALAYVFKRVALAFAAAGAWLVLGIYSYTLSAETWDIYYGLFFLGIGLALVAVLEAMSLRGMTKEEEEEETELSSEEKNIAKMEAMRERMDRLDEAMGGSSERRRRRRPRDREVNNIE